MSSVLAEPPLRGDAPAAPPAAPPVASGPPAAGGAGPRNSTLTVIAGVGVLLLAMGVGVLIGRSGVPKPVGAPAQVISVAAPTSTGSGASGSSEQSFTSDWPSGTTGYTVQLHTLAQSATSVSTVESDKTAASAKGAKAVGALRSEEFSSLSAGNYVIYSGVYHRKAEAEKALGGLKKSFPGATVISVSGGGSGSSSGGGGSTAGGAGSSSGGAGSSPSHPAPPSVLKNLKGAKGKSYEEKSKNLPNVVETG